MGTRTKALITLGLVVIVVGAIIWQTGETDLFKGQLRMDRPAEEEVTDEDVTEEEVAEAKLPNLEADVEVIMPEEEDGDLIMDVTIRNLGPGAVTGDVPYHYALYVNDTEIFRNTDTYTSMDAGDAISFQYPVSRKIFEYPDTGTVRVVVDTENVLSETDKSNNIAEARYAF